MTAGGCAGSLVVRHGNSPSGVICSILLCFVSQRTWFGENLIVPSIPSRQLVLTTTSNSRPVFFVLGIRSVSFCVYNVNYCDSDLRSWYIGRLQLDHHTCCTRPLQLFHRTSRSLLGDDHHWCILQSHRSVLLPSISWINQLMLPFFIWFHSLTK